MDIDQLFTAADREAVREAVRAAETGTAGEIVPYVVPASDAYAGAVWKGTALGALGGPLLAWAAFSLGGFWGTHLNVWIALPAAAGGGAGFPCFGLRPPGERGGPRRAGRAPPGGRR